MDLTRRALLKTGLILGSFFALMQARSSFANQRDEVLKGGNGLYVQPWFEDSFLDLVEELDEAEKSGKQLILLYEQAGCPYCKELHKVNFAKDAIQSFMKKHFRVIQLDIKGSREVTDFSGQTMTERAFSQTWNIHFTPTLSFFPRQKANVIGKSGREAEAFRLTGYWKPFHFETVLHFVHTGSYKNENLQSYLSNRVKDMKKNGKQVELWN